MKAIEDIQLEMTVSGAILDLVREAMAGELDGIPNGDLQGICEALAATIIQTVKGK